ncbi:MAG: rhomboid family intramembrane serine protease [Proteobacteria bacterium]|nr:rhomboid family intramembrane serine protease [Pseudomonadota bacterium]
MTQHIYQRQPVRGGSIPTVIFGLLIANGLTFAAQNLLGQDNVLDQYFALWPIGSPWANFYPWQLLTYGFMHSDRDVMHIIFNLLMLWMFGRELEVLMGARRFLTYYLTCVVGAGVVQLIVAGLQGGGYPTVGASGGVFGLLLAFGMAFPNRMIMLMFPPIPMKAKYMVILFGLLELYLGLSGMAPGIANFAHLGGMLFGYLLIQRWKSARR